MYGMLGMGRDVPFFFACLDAYSKDFDAVPVSYER